MSRTKVHRWAVLGAAVVVAACGVGSARRAETVPVEPLPIAADTILTPYSDVPEAAWLGGRRWVVVAADHDEAIVADFDARKATKIGGDKNTEIKKPFGAFTVSDTAFVRDWSTGRLTVWAGGMTLAGAIPGPIALNGALPRARDAAGQYYFEIPPKPGPDGSGNKDSIAVVRSNAGFTTFDTIARLSPIEVQEVQRNSGTRYERLVYSGQDWWGIRPDGRLWIARVHKSRVNRLVNGKERAGEDLPDPVYEVTRADRIQFVNSFPPEVRGTVEDLPFAPLKPPFDRAMAGPDGTVWLRKSRAITDSIRRYQVVDTAGTLARVFTTLGQGLIIAVGRDAVLMAEQYRQGVRLLELRIPAALPRP